MWILRLPCTVHNEMKYAALGIGEIFIYCDSSDLGYQMRKPFTGIGEGV
jgi:hypothetical protein